MQLYDERSRLDSIASVLSARGKYNFDAPTQLPLKCFNISFLIYCNLNANDKESITILPKSKINVIIVNLELIELGLHISKT